ncbi:hypothetical protein [Nocardioides sp. J54]|uniref:hypothetical protein n=1 Tax=Nocardioides sp. J54 TaxID=935866 RepID=UPI0004BCA769|nr:hypothetical protein [Nocardioides sp. J54]
MSTVRPGRGAYAALLLVAVLVNLPLLHHTWQQWRIDRDGVDVTAEVTDTDVLREESDPHHVVRFRLPEDVDPSGRTWPAQVDPETWQRAEETGEVGVRVLPGEPGAHHVDGEQPSVLGWVVIGVVDVIVLLLALLLWRIRRTGMTSEVIARDTSHG